MSELTNTFNELNELDYPELTEVKKTKVPDKFEVDNLIFEACDLDIDFSKSRQVYEIDFCCSISIKEPDGSIKQTPIFYNVYAEVAQDIIDYKWEADGESTYVDYGSQKVLYDNGEGGLESAKLQPNFVDILDDRFSDKLDLYWADTYVWNTLNKTPEELDEILKQVQTYMEAYIAQALISKIEDNADYWPEREMSEPDDYE